MKKLFITFLISIYAMMGFGQPYIIENFNMEHGLSSNYTQDITQDRKGYIWVATGSGLNRFDGHNFIIYNKYNSGLSSNELNTVLADPLEDWVWIGTQRDGLCIYDYATNRIKSYKSTDGLLTNDVTHLSVAADNGIWITHYHYGVEYYDRTTNTFVPYSYRNVEGLEGYCWASADDGQGNLYIGHDGQGLSIVNIQEKKAVNFRHSPSDPYSIPSNIVRSICIDNNKNVWIGTDKGLSLFNPHNGRFTTFQHAEKNDFSLLSDQIYDIRQMKDGSLWICSNMGGVSILNLQGNTFSTPENVLFLNIAATNDNHGLSSPNARCILQDTYGNIWIGNFRGGIDFISHTQPFFNLIDYYSNQPGKASNKQVWALSADENALWIGGENELVQYKDNQLKTKSLKSIQAHPQTHINVILQDKRERLWMGLYMDGVAYYDLRKQTFQRVGNQASKDLDVRCLYEDHDGKIWIGAEQGLYSYNGQWKEETEVGQQLTDYNIHGIQRDRNGNLWIGTFSKGINLLNKENQRTHAFTQDNGFPSNAINHLIVDSKGRIWAATREGLVVFPDVDQPENYIHYGIQSGLANTQVRAIQEDLKGNIWVSTNTGISRIDEKEGRFYNYSHHDGIPMGDFMDGSACISKKGTIHFGSQNGVCYFNPEQLSSVREASPAIITQFIVYEKMTEEKGSGLSMPLTNEPIKLSHQQSTFNISFNVQDFSQSSKVDFAYMLEGLSNEWYNTQGENLVTFRNIPPGEYTFKVKARFRNQEWNKDIASIRIDIAPPLWLSWYAKLFYFLLSCLIIYIISSTYKRRLKLENKLKIQQEKENSIQELNNERLRFFTNITHELRTPLTLILGPLEDLLADKTLSAKQNNKISIIHDSSLRLLNLINHILEFRKTETQNRQLAVAKGNIAKLIQEIGLRYKELNRNPHVKYHIEVETRETELFFDTEMITMILDNLLSNASKYTPKGDIRLRLRSVEENQIHYTEISVCDTGHGISAEALPHIFDRYYQAKSSCQVAGSGIGLALVKGLADLHEASLSVESTQGVGTTFSLRLLTNNTYPNAIHEQVEEKPQPVITAAETGSEQSAEEQPVILVIEDNDDIREYIRTSLEDSFKIFTASQGQEGLEQALAQMPDVILSDVMMPVMDGLELCRELKKDIRTCHIPVVLLTAKDSLHDKEEGYAAGADSYITKPFSANLLHSRIVNILESRKRIAAALNANTVSAATEEEGNGTLSHLDNEFLRKITQIIEEHIDMEKMDIAFIADKMFMSHSTLYRKIKALTEMSANEYIRKVKMRKSIELLKESGHTISEVAFMLGFSSSAYFRQCFKDEYGMSPSEYLKKK